MAGFFKKHQSGALVALAIAFVVVIASFAFWGVKILLGSLAAANSIPSGSGSSVQFNFEGAKKLNLPVE